MNITEAMTDPALFGDQFAGESWAAWRSLLAGFYGLPTDKKLFKQLTQRKPPKAAADELWLTVGRRGGKSNTAALLAVYEACFNDYSEKLAPGEVATVMVVAADRKQARSAMRYIRGLLEANPMLQRMVVKDGQEIIELSNRTAIEIMTASHKSIRGYTVAAAILDEIAFWSSEGANPDSEILSALRPAMATLGGKLIALSSPYARRGVLWDTYHKHFGKENKRVLVAQAPSLLMNPSLPKHVVDEAMESDPAAARAEYLAEFRTDVETFISREAAEAVTVPARHEIPPIAGVKYVAFVDPSGGSKDAFTMAIAHKENDVIIVDAVRTRKPPFSPESVVDEFCDTLKEYRVTEVTGDRYAGEWPREQFRKRGVNYKTADKPKSDLYRDLLPVINSGVVELLDIPQMQRELVGLERRTARGGRDSIDHAPGQHDDLINAVAGVISVAKKPNDFIFSCTDDDAPVVSANRGLAVRGSNHTDDVLARGKSLVGFDDGVFFIN